MQEFLSAPLEVGRVYSFSTMSQRSWPSIQVIIFDLLVGVVRTCKERWTDCRVSFLTWEVVCVADGRSSSCDDVVFSHNGNSAL